MSIHFLFHNFEHDSSFSTNYYCYFLIISFVLKYKSDFSTLLLIFWHSSKNVYKFLSKSRCLINILSILLSQPLIFPHKQLIFPGFLPFPFLTRTNQKHASQRRGNFVQYFNADVSISNFKPTQIVPTIPKHRLEYNLATTPLDF